MEFKHESVLLKETMEYLNVNPDGIYVDGTLGGGGHAYEVCRRLSPKGKLIGIDQDEDAVEAAVKRLSEFNGRVQVIRDNYRRMGEVLEACGIRQVDGILLDLGVSSYQLDDPNRGFTYRDGNAPLDMRMDNRQKFTARDLVNTYSEMELYRVIRDYGEDRFAKNIAKHIVAAREQKEIETAGELIEAVKAAIPAKVRMGGGHPAKRTFQAIRIELNGELEVLKDSLEDMIGLLRPGGRICVITFHSLEDRIVKNILKKSEKPSRCPEGVAVGVCGKKPLGRALARKPVLPSEEEMTGNPRSKSAKLRAFERAGLEELRQE